MSIRQESLFRHSHGAGPLMPTHLEILKGGLLHTLLLFINFCIFLGIIQSISLFTAELPLLNMLILAYMVVHTILLMSLQLGIQVVQLIRLRIPTVLITYYFSFSDEEPIPIPILDPIRSKVAVLALLLVISGGPIFYPIFAVYGFLVAYAHLIRIALDPSTIVYYFGLFLNWMPPLLALIVAVLILSVIIIEFKHA